MLPFLWDNILSPAVFFCSVHISKCAICELCSIPTSWKHFVKGGGCTWQRPDKNPYRYRYPDVIQLSDIWNMSVMQINTIWKETFCTVSLKWSFSSRAAFASLSQPSVEQEGVTVIMAYIIFCINIIEKYPNLKPSITHQIRQSLEESMKLSDRMETQTQSRGFSPLYCVPHVLPSALNFLHTIPKSLIILQVPEDKKIYIYIYIKKCINSVMTQKFTVRTISEGSRLCFENLWIKSRLFVASQRCSSLTVTSVGQEIRRHPLQAWQSLHKHFTYN